MTSPAEVTSRLIIIPNKTILRMKYFIFYLYRHREGEIYYIYNNKNGSRLHLGFVYLNHHRRSSSRSFYYIVNSEVIWKRCWHWQWNISISYYWTFITLLNQWNSRLYPILEWTHCCRLLRLDSGAIIFVYLTNEIENVIPVKWLQSIFRKMFWITLSPIK